MFRKDDGRCYPPGTDKSQADVYCKIMTITPEIAKEMLSFNTKRNRTLKKNFINSTAAAIKRGAWVINSNGIGFDIHHNLTDGQNRLNAIILAGQPVRSIVAYNLPPRAFVTTDNGTKRSYADIANICGYDYSKFIGAAANLLYRYTQGSFRHTAMPTNDQVESLLSNCPGLAHSAKVAAQVIHVLPPSIGTFCHYIFSEKDAVDADLFYEGLRSGAGLPVNDPILALRNKMFQNKGFVAKLQQHYIIAITIKAWNAWRNNKKLQVLRWTPKTGESFPRPI